MANPTLGLDTEGSRTTQPVEVGQVHYSTFDSDSDNCSLSQPQSDIPHRGHMSTLSYNPVQDERERIMTTTGPNCHDEQVALDMNLLSGSEEHYQPQYPRSRSDYSDIYPGYNLNRNQAQGYRRTRSGSYSSRDGGEPPLSILKKRDQGNPEQQVSSSEVVHGFQADQDYIDLLPIRTAGISHQGRDTDAESGGSRKSKSVQWNSHKSVRTFRRHIDQGYFPETPETDSIHSVEYEEPVHESSAASSYSSDSTAEQTSTNELERCLTATVAYFNTEGVESDEENSNDDQPAATRSRQWIPKGLKRRSLSGPIREKTQISSDKQARNSACFSPEQESQSPRSSLFKPVSSSAKPNADSKPSWWTRITASYSPRVPSPPVISSPLARSPQLYPDYEEYDRQFAALFMDRYQDEHQSCEPGDRSNATDSVNGDREGSPTLSSRTGGQSLVSQLSYQGSSYSESNGEGLSRASQQQSGNPFVSNELARSSRRRDNRGKRKQVKVVMIPPRSSSAAVTPEPENMGQPDTVHASERELPSPDVSAIDEDGVSVKTCSKPDSTA